MAGIFISHTNTDRIIAEALSALVRELFGKKVDINYSSSKELDGGIAPGADWFNWIVNQVRDSDLAFIMRPLDVRVHRRLGELYARAGMAPGAVRQFELARQLAPRGIFLFRRQGKAYLDVGDREKCREVLEAIESLDSNCDRRQGTSNGLHRRPRASAAVA